MSRIDPYFSDEIRKYGADDFNACFNCGNCTAVCSLSDKDASFPRMMIRYGMLGLKKEILESKELWLCYACGDCTETCPRQADPGHYMAALRRYAIAKYEPTGITGLIFKNNPISVMVTLILAVILGFFLFTLRPDHDVARWIFAWMPFDVIHDMGMVIFGLTGLAMVIGLISMLRHMFRNNPVKGTFKSARQALSSVISEIVTLKRYQDCDKEQDSHWYGKPWYLQPWFVHWSIMWGFIGLFLATVLDFLLKDPATDIWWPSRILGTIAGLLMMYGASAAMYYRITKPTKAYEDTRLADWMFLVFLWIAGLTGFWLEIAVTFDGSHDLNQVVFVIHTIISMELVLLFAFSKFAHALYRPLALFSYFYHKLSTPVK